MLSRQFPGFVSVTEEVAEGEREGGLGRRRRRRRHVLLVTVLELLRRKKVYYSGSDGINVR